MFGSNRAYDKLSKRNVELARKVKELDDKLENRNILIADMEEQAKVLHDENKDLRFENEELRDIIKEIDNLSKTQQYGSVKNLQNKIKSILMTSKSI